MPVSDFLILARWRRWLFAQELSEKTVRLYTYGAFRFLLEWVEGPPAVATEEQLVDFLNSIGKHSEAKAKYLLGIRSLFKYCARRGHAEADITEGIRLRRHKGRPQVALAEEELYRIWCAAYERDPKRAWAIALHFGLGTRRMEVNAIDPSQDVQGDEVELRHTKGGKVRRVPMSNIARVALEQLRPHWNGTVLGGISDQTLTHWGHQAAEDAGLLHKVRGRTTHVFRATYATYLLRKGMPIQDVAALLGHASIATTHVYAVSDPERRREGIQESGL